MSQLDGREILVREDRDDPDLQADGGRRAPGGGGKSRRGSDAATPGGGYVARDSSSRGAAGEGSASGLQARLLTVSRTCDTLLTTIVYTPACRLRRAPQSNSMRRS